MATKLTLRLDERLIASAKIEARNRGASLSKMVADYFRGIDSREASGTGLPPVTASLVGSLKGKRLDRAAYRRHLEQKHR
jgi:hypothetical protein